MEPTSPPDEAMPTSSEQKNPTQMEVQTPSSVKTRFPYTDEELQARGIRVRKASGGGFILPMRDPSTLRKIKPDEPQK